MVRVCRAPVLAALAALLGCDSEAGGRGVDPGADAGAEDAAPADASPVDAGPSTCDPAPYQGVDRCDLIGYSYPCDFPLVVADGTNIAWDTDPPTSGDHYRDPASWGEHVEPVARGTWVANLARGGVVLLHNCPEGCDRELEDLRDVLSQRPDRDLLLTPDPLLPGPRRFAAVAWTWLERTDAPDVAALLCFVDQHEGMAPPDLP